MRVEGSNPYVLVYFDLETKETVVESAVANNNAEWLLRQGLYVVKNGEDG